MNPARTLPRQMGTSEKAATMKNLYPIRVSLAALALALSPAFAMARPVPAAAPHTRTATIHDRSPKMHTHESVAHH
jgi:hypothetical protein